MILDDQSVRPASLPFGIGIAMLGAMTFAFNDAVAGLELIPAALGAARMPAAYFAAVVLVAGGVSIASGRMVRVSCLTIGVVLGVWLLLHVRALALAPRSGSEWVCACETLSLWSAAWALAGMTPGRRGAGGSGVPIPPWVCIAALGVACVVFGISHFVYIGYVESVLPAWLPWHPFWGYATGVAHVAAGLALVTRVRARLAATLLGVMFGSWVLILHLPRVVHDPHNRSEWTSMAVALAMCGASWVIATLLARVSVAAAARGSLAVA